VLFRSAAELSYFGARILHPRTVEPLVDSDIPIVIKNIFDPKKRGTRISKEGYRRKGILKSVTFNKDIAVLKIKGAGVGYKPGIISEMSRRLSDLNLNIYSIITSQTCINLLLDRNDLHRSFEALRQLSGGVIEKIETMDNVALIAVVGEGLLRTHGLAAKVFSAVAREKLNVEMISAGASEVAYYFIIKRKDLSKAIHAIHEEYLEKHFNTGGRR
jgi:aspartate kinase